MCTHTYTHTHTHVVFVFFGDGGGGVEGRSLWERGKGGGGLLGHVHTHFYIGLFIAIGMTLLSHGASLFNKHFLLLCIIYVCIIQCMKWNTSDILY